MRFVFHFIKLKRWTEIFTFLEGLSYEGREGVKWELGFAFFRGWEMGFCALGLGFMKKNNRKMGMGFQFEQHRLGMWDLSWDLKETISWEMGLAPHPPFTTLSYI